MKVLIAGAGIAGPTLAYWLTRYGFTSTLIEKAPGLRTGGYVIDFWGAGYEIAERMGLLPEIIRKGYEIQEVRVVNRSGRRVAGFPASTFRRVAQGRYTSLPRSDLAASIFRQIEGKVETIFGDSVAGVEQSEAGVHVTFERASARDFDLVVGADGLHSRVRELIFGPEAQFEKHLGYRAAAFQVEGYRPRDELVYVIFTEVGQQVTRFAMRGDRTMFLFTFADPDAGGPDIGDVEAQKNLLRTRFGSSGWECRQILDALGRTSDLYCDRVSQIQMDAHPGWARGRIILLGDAAFCVSLLAGQGSALAMTAAYILAGELHRAGNDYRRAFSRYQERFGPFVLKKQKAALRFAEFFAPGSGFSLFMRNQIMNLMRIPWVADLAVGRDMADRIALPEYE